MCASVTGITARCAHIRLNLLDKKRRSKMRRAELFVSCGLFSWIRSFPNVLEMSFMNLYILRCLRHMPEGTVLFRHSPPIPSTSPAIDEPSTSFTERYTT